MPNPQEILLDISSHEPRSELVATVDIPVNPFLLDVSVQVPEFSLIALADIPNEPVSLDISLAEVPTDLEVEIDIPENPFRVDVTNQEDAVMNLEPGEPSIPVVFDIDDLPTGSETFDVNELN